MINVLLDTIHNTSNKEYKFWELLIPSVKCGRQKAKNS